VYRLEANDDPVFVEVTATNHVTGIAVPRTPLRWIDTRDGSAWDIRTDLKGYAKVALPRNRAYRVTASAPGYIVDEAIITTTADTTPWNIDLARVRSLNDANFASKYMEGHRLNWPRLNGSKKALISPGKGKLSFTNWRISLN
jgi:hypothetical protein